MWVPFARCARGKSNRHSASGRGTIWTANFRVRWQNGGESAAVDHRLSRRIDDYYLPRDFTAQIYITSTSGDCCCVPFAIRSGLQMQTEKKHSLVIIVLQIESNGGAVLRRTGGGVRRRSATENWTQKSPQRVAGLVRAAEAGP